MPEILFRHFRGCVPFDRQQKLVMRHATAIVGNADHAAATIGHDHINLMRTGIDGVLNQFLYSRSRPFNHFTCGNTIDEVRRKKTNGHAVRYPVQYGAERVDYNTVDPQQASPSHHLWKKSAMDY